MRLITSIATLIRYRLLEKFEVTIKESELAKLAGLRTEWATYKTMLQEAGFAQSRLFATRTPLLARILVADVTSS